MNVAHQPQRDNDKTSSRNFNMITFNINEHSNKLSSVVSDECGCASMHRIMADRSRSICNITLINIH